jgi:hypothetical protein
MEALVYPALILALSAGGYWLLRRRARRVPPAPVAQPPVAEPAPPQPPPPATINVAVMRPLVCPTCGGQYPPGLRYCPIDARALVMSSEWSIGSVVPVICKACQRTFEAGTRFCPYDAQELIPDPQVGAATPPALPMAIAVAAPGGKICPSCTERYAGSETFCGRDGSELVTLN